AECDGQEAFQLIEQTRPDILLLDIGMPVLDGFAVVRKIRENLRLATLPVLAVTAYGMQGDREKILNSGFDGYLSKPISAVALAEALEPLLSKPQGRSDPPNQSYESQASEETRVASAILGGGTNLE